jgi:hypothetical protein
MSEILRIALVAEGPTDKIVIEAALRAILGGRLFKLQQIFPEESAAFALMGTGWVGVYRWCHAAAARGNGRLSDDGLVFGAGNYDLLILHLDADVAACQYSDGSIIPLPSDAVLPCATACPPPEATTDELRKVLLSWSGEAAIPPRTVLCTPSKSTEAWVVALLFPADRANTLGIECYVKPESRLGQQPAALRIRKNVRDYLGCSVELEQAWPRIASSASVGEAFRFQNEFLAAVPASPTPPILSSDVPGDSVSLNSNAEDSA